MNLPTSRLPKPPKIAAELPEIATEDMVSDVVADAAPATCPKCGKALIDPAGLGWCSGCGYCKSLNDENKLVEQRRRPLPAIGGMVAAGGAVSSLPLWFWASGLFIAIGIAISIFANKRLPEGDNFERALWASLQIAIGLFIVFLAQCWALMSIAPEDPKLTFKDAIAPFRLWVLVVKRLPRLKGSLWAAVFGLSLIVGSATFIGGFVHWFDYLPKNAAVREREKARGDNAPVVLQVD